MIASAADGRLDRYGIIGGAGQRTALECQCQEMSTQLLIMMQKASENLITHQAQMKGKRFPCGICSNKRRNDSSLPYQNSQKCGVNVTTHNSLTSSSR